MFACKEQKGTLSEKWPNSKKLSISEEELCKLQTKCNQLETETKPRKKVGEAQLNFAPASWIMLGMICQEDF